jgi:putative oxidoreductase
MNDVNRLTVACARTLMALLFLIAGVRKLLDWGGTMAYFAKLGVPLPELIVPLTVLIEIGGGLALVTGWKIRIVASGMAIYTLGTALIAHRFWQVDAAQFSNQLNNFFKNIAMIGGFLLLIVQPQRR